MQARLAAVIAGVALIAGATAWLALSRGSEAPHTPDAGTDAGATSAPPAPIATAESVPAVESGKTVVVESADVLADGLILDLVLGEPAPSSEPLTGRILTAERVLELSANVEKDPMRARILVPPGWLTPDRYMIEIETHEKSHFPLRRYVVEVR